MPWIKNKKGNYVLSSSQSHYIPVSELSLDDLNDPKRHFETKGNYIWVEEHVDRLDYISLPSGIYKAHIKYGDFRGLTEFSPTKDSVLLPLNSCKEVLEDFNSFLQHRDIFNKLKLTYKTGILLYGPPGTGKTTAINLIIDQIKSLDPLVIFFDTNICYELLEELKTDSRLKILIFEELTQSIQGDSNIGEFLTFLDGQHSLENCYVIASTNYPEKLPGNLLDRPGRLDKLFKIDYLNEEDRKTYIKHFLNREATEEEVKMTENLSIAAIKNILLRLLMGYDIKALIKDQGQRLALIKTEFATSVKEDDLDDYIL